MSKPNFVMKGCAILVLWAASATALTAQTFNVLYNFCSQGGDCTDGAEPFAPLYQAANGKLYGTTEVGAGAYGVGAGTIFTITPEGHLTTLVSLHCTLARCPEGADPTGPLIQATDGNIYGSEWGQPSTPHSYLFKLTPQGKYTAYEFCQQSDCGYFPRTGVIQATDGNIYGTTQAGGSYDCGGADCGTIFEFMPTGNFTTLHIFESSTGAEPGAGVIEGPAGNLYGTTLGGGSEEYGCGVSDGCGVVYKLSPSGMFTMLYEFCLQADCPDGGEPEGNLLLGSDGNFYGVTVLGGQVEQNCNGGCGTIFRITPDGALTTLHAFDYSDGSGPANALIQGSDGNYYGTTTYGGAYGNGTIFAMAPDGTLTTLYNFCSQPDCPDGQNANSLFQDTNGMFYGTTAYGGANGDGIIFTLSLGLGPFVTTNPSAGKAGATVGILGTDFTGASSVSFNGTATAFRVVSPTFIEAKVPSGATNGKIQVLTPNGTLSSNVPFVVLH